MNHLQKVTCVIATITFSTALAPRFLVMTLIVMNAPVAHHANVVAKKALRVIAMDMFQMQVKTLRNVEDPLSFPDHSKC